MSSKPQSAIGSPRLSDRALAAWEVVAVVASVLIAEWVVFALAGDNNPPALMFPVATVFAFMFLSHRLRGESARDVGFRLDNFWQAVRLLVLPLAVVTALLFAFGWYFSTLDLTRWRGGTSIFGVAVLSLLWGPLQQYALQGFINRRAQVVFGPGWMSIIFVALVFATLHLPNPWLTAATFAVGLLWAYVFQRAPNIIAIGISHLVMTWVLISSVPPAALHNLRVGFKFFGQ
jgi:membrane protease YdiL (CAAX protease family)